ncbi:MAG: pyruvate carboxylase subunit B, partial [Filifactoraceae bacterium]
DGVGYNALEAWGGATFDSCLRYLNEDPWERLKSIKLNIKNTKLQMLLRGKNLLGYKHYPDNIVSYFIERSIYHGVDIIRVFDALNDIRNIEGSVKSIIKFGGEAQCALAYTTSEVHTVDYFVNLAKEYENIGASSLCIKDMAGVLLPDVAFELVSRIKENSNLTLHLHSHMTSGIANITYLKAIEAGVNVIDTALSPFSGGNSQPSTESMVAVLKGLGYTVNLNLDKMNSSSDYFRVIKEKYDKNNVFKKTSLETDSRVLYYQIPGGMLSNLVSQLEKENMMNHFESVLTEVPKVRKDLGYPPLVTPMSQMVGTQAVLNVSTNTKYKFVPKEIKDYVKGKYGKTPVEISREIKETILGEKYIEDPDGINEFDIKKLKSEISLYMRNDEDVLSYIMFPDITKKFLEGKFSEINKVEISYFENNLGNHPI